MALPVKAAFWTEQVLLGALGSQAADPICYQPGPIYPSNFRSADYRTFSVSFCPRQSQNHEP
jgi:hypothetical protein